MFSVKESSIGSLVKRDLKKNPEFLLFRVSMQGCNFVGNSCFCSYLSAMKFVFDGNSIEFVLQASRTYLNLPDPSNKLINLVFRHDMFQQKIK